MTDPRDLSLPPRFRSSAFRRYESVLAQAVENSPNEVIVDPKDFGLSFTTVEQRLRDARKSFYDHAWESTINHAKFVVLVDTGSLEVRGCTDGKVHIGQPPQEVSDDIRGLVSKSNSTNKKPLLLCKGVLADGNPKIGLAYALIAFLASERALCRPIQLALSPSVADELYASYDISLEQQPDGTYILT
jgi:hypothetical protein